MFAKSNFFAQMNHETSNIEDFDDQFLVIRDSWCVRAENVLEVFPSGFVTNKNAFCG